ncbi:MAG: nuclear transport factor 2 family protein [Caulobacteraceae bacterium]|nr:nuclear transport factor 2 family protein [Caulobacteraceae bacterium]
MSLDLEDFNRRWLQAWTDKDVPRLLGFYSSDTIYADPQTAAGIQGHEALGAYLTGLFGATPPMTYEPHELWATHNGYCGRWFCTISPPGGPVSYLRGFDLVVLEGDKIVRNEVFVHPLEALPTL